MMQLVTDKTNTLVQIMSSVAGRMRADFDGSNVTRHGGMAGTAREAIVANFLSSYLPGHVQALHGGEIIASDGAVSRQCDIVIADRSTPPLLDATGLRVIPCECVYGVIEVKTNLTKKKLIEACDNLRAAKLLKKVAYYGPEDGYHSFHHPQQIPSTVGMIFAFDSPGLESVGENLRQWCQGKPCTEWPEGIYILGKGTVGWYDVARGMWNAWPRPDDVVSILSSAPGYDVLLPLVLALNTYFSRSWMHPWRLMDYVKDVSLSAGPVQYWIE